MRQLTDKEKSLTQYIDRGLVYYSNDFSGRLYKYYATDEERCEIPDIWDKLHDDRDKLLDCYDRERLAYARATAEKANHWRINRIKNKIASYDNSISLVENSDAEYFIFSDRGLTEVKETQLYAYKLVIKDSKVDFEQTSDVVTVWVLNGPTHIGPFTYLAQTQSGKDIVVDPDVSEMRLDDTYVFFQRDMPTIPLNDTVCGEYRVCRDCKSIFELTSAEIDFYKNHSLKLPTRCQACRNKRKKGFEPTCVFR